MMLKFIAAAALLLSSTPTFADVPPDRVHRVFDDAETLCPTANALSETGDEMNLILAQYGAKLGYSQDEQALLTEFCVMYLKGVNRGLSERVS